MAVVANGPTGELRIESTPDGARVMLDGKESGFTPLTLNNVPAGRHLLVLEGENGTVRRTVRVQAGERTIARYEITGGFIAITSKFPVEVYENNKRIGISTEGHIALAPGRHKVTLVNGRYNYRADVELDGQGRRDHDAHRRDCRWASSSSTPRRARKSSSTASASDRRRSPPIPAAVGAREVLVRHVDHGERRQSVDVTPGKPVELSVIFEGTTTGPRPQPKLAPLSMPPAATPVELAPRAGSCRIIDATL